jgi:pyruvate dehydrogenase E1 component alpha subunit
VIFLCENNSVGAVTQKAGEYPSSTLAVGTLADLAAPFGIPSVVIDGADSQAVHDAMRDAIERARGGAGPTFVEARTVRWPGNQGIWAELVTGRVEVAFAWDEAAIPAAHRAWFAEHDPIVRYARELRDAGATAEAITELDLAARQEMEAAVAFALASPWPETRTAFEGLYGDERVNRLATGAAEREAVR